MAPSVWRSRGRAAAGQVAFALATDTARRACARGASDRKHHINRHVCVWSCQRRAATDNIAATYASGRVPAAPSLGAAAQVEPLDKGRRAYNVLRTSPPLQIYLSGIFIY